MVRPILLHGAECWTVDKKDDFNPVKEVTESQMEGKGGGTTSRGTWRSCDRDSANSDGRPCPAVTGVGEEADKRILQK